MNIFKEMALSIYSFKSYPQFLNNKKGKVFGFGLLLMLLYFCIIMVVPFAKFLVVDGGIGQLIEDYVPDFEFTTDALWVEDVVEYDIDDTYICIDTDPESYFYGADEIAEYLYNYSNVILMDSEKIIFKSDGAIQEFYCSDLELEFSREDLVAFVPTIYIIIVIFMIIVFLCMTAGFFFGVLIVALLGMIVSSFMKCPVTFGKLYQMGVYSRTLPLILKAVLTQFSLSIPWFINFGISLFILIRAMQQIKEDQEQQSLNYTSSF